MYFKCSNTQHFTACAYGRGWQGDMIDLTMTSETDMLPLDITMQLYVQKILMSVFVWTHPFMTYPHVNLGKS